MILDRLRQIRESKRLKAFYARNERVLVPGFLFVGFLFDLFTYRTLRPSTTFLVLGIYTIVAAGAIVYSNAFDARGTLPIPPVMTRLRLAVPLIVQFVFGALLSQSLLFYWFGGAASTSWPILAVMTGLMVSNETFRHYYLRPVVQVGVFAFAVFSYFSVLFPYMFNSLSERVFLLGALADALVCLLLVLALAHYAPTLRAKWKHLAGSVLAVCGVMITFYFLNVIPPLPLSIREAGVYHDVKKSGSVYTLITEPESWFRSWIPGKTIHLRATDPVYVFASVFSPAHLNTTIVHHWYYFDDTKDKWIGSDRFSYNIVGGREAGYRGFSFKTNVRAGAWRVDIETTRGQVLGRVGFQIDQVAELPPLYEVQT